MPQVLYEFTHVCTDARRFDEPFTITEALRVAQYLWDSREVTRLSPDLAVLTRAFDLMGTYRLGRKRILDTVLAATLERAQVRKLATFNGADFRLVR